MTPPEDASVTASTGNARDGAAHKNSPQSSSKDPAMNALIARLDETVRGLNAFLGYDNGGDGWKPLSALRDDLTAALSHLREGSGTGATSDLSTPYCAHAVHYPEADSLEFVQRDVPTIAQPTRIPTLTILIDMMTREPIGWRIYGWSGIRPVSPSPDKVEEVEHLRSALAALEAANDAVCAGRSQAAYLEMIASGQSEALVELDAARSRARHLLGLLPSGGGGGS